MGKIIHGNKNFGYAPILDNNGVYSFGTPVFLDGMVSSSAEVEQSTTSIYADDATYCLVKGAKTRNLNIGLRYINKEYAQYLGYVLNRSGMLTDTGRFPNHCVFFETEEEDCETGISTSTLHYFYNVKASEPNKETNTDEEEVEAVTLSVSYSALASQFVVDDNGDYVQYGYITRTEENASYYDTFKQTVLLPVQSESTPTYSYVEVTPEANENPSEQGWYELNDGQYILSADETVVEGKTYYQRVSN